MVEVIDFRLVSEEHVLNETIKDILELALTYNRENDYKISIFKSFQEISISFNELNEEFECTIKGQLVPHGAIAQLIDRGYCVIKNKLFFVSSETSSVLKNIFRSDNATQKLNALNGLKNSTGLSKEEQDKFLSSLNTSVQKDPNITLDIELYPYQKKGFEWLKSRYRYRLSSILADDMGLGKTAQVIALITDSLANGIAKKILIVVPNSLIANWLNEFTKFTNGINPHVHWGPERIGFASELKKYQVIITTYSTVVNDLSLLKKVFFDILVCDEASLLKNPDSQRTLAISKLSIGTIIEITGTPFENSMRDLWSLSNLVENNFLGDREMFERRFVQRGVNELNDSDVAEIEEKLRPIFLRRMKEEVLKELPTRQDIVKPLTMNTAEKKVYDDIENCIRASKNNRSSAFALISHLRKFTSHPLLSNDQLSYSSISELESTSAKFSYLLGLVNKINYKSQKALVFANHIKLIDTFTRLFEDEYGIKSFKIDGSIIPELRQNVVDEFSAVDGTALLFLNPITAGMGLNITSANHVIHYSRQWNPALEEQATARAYRNGQKNKVDVYYLYYADTIEEVVHERILAKSYVSGNVIRSTSTFEREEDMLFQLIIDKDN
jgi:SNF2 family DNA or RNA helicase